MSHLKNPRLRKGATLATALLVGATIFAVATTARGASHRAQAATLELIQTCSDRVEPGSSISVQATVQNTGDEALIITPPGPDADAGTPDNATDDFFLTYQSGDNPPLGQLGPGETWTYAGSFTAPSEDVTNIVGVDAISTPGGTDVSDIAPCETDVIQQAQPGRIAGVTEVAGTVLVKVKGTDKFVALDGETEIPVGSQVNTLKGTVALTAGLGGGKTNSAELLPGHLHDPAGQEGRGRHDAPAGRWHLPRLQGGRGEDVEHRVHAGEEAGAEAVGQRQGALQLQGQVRGSDGQRDEVADGGPLRRNARQGGAGGRQSPGLPQAQDRQSSGGPQLPGQGAGLLADGFAADLLG